MVVLGTRPEAIKLAPVIHALRARAGVATTVCVTGQHRELLADPLALFGIEPDVDLCLMTPGQGLEAFLSKARSALDEVMQVRRPVMTLVQGDTATALAATQVAYSQGIAVGHVEAGLRSGNPADPYPEEIYRRSISRLATLHFAPTRSARDALLSEGVPADRIYVTGNSGIDALHMALGFLDADEGLSGKIDRRFGIDFSRPLILVTAHRRESFGGPLASILTAVGRLAAARDVHILLPVHPNPVVQTAVEQTLHGLDNIRPTSPLSYLELVHSLRRARLVLTDSGGIQEEAPSLGVPVLVLRRTTERPEGVHAGNARLVGTDADTIFHAALELLDDRSAHAAMATVRSPYGDGQAGERIAGIVRNWLAEQMIAVRPRPALGGLA